MCCVAPIGDADGSRGRNGRWLPGALRWEGGTAATGASCDPNALLQLSALLCIAGDDRAV